MNGSRFSCITPACPANKDWNFCYWNLELIFNLFSDRHDFQCSANYIVEEKKLESSSPVLRRSTSFKFDINQTNLKIKLKFRERMELGNGFSCTTAQVCPAQNLTTNVISGQSFLWRRNLVHHWSLCTFLKLRQIGV